VLLGVPHDAGVSQSPGARFAPYHVRRVSVFVVNGETFARLGRVVDGGNVPAPLCSPRAMRELVEAEIGAVLATGAAPFLVGGDHSVVLPVLRAMKKRHDDLAVVHFDAHADTGRPQEFLSDDPYHHGAVMRHALEEGLIARGQLHQIGIRLAYDVELAAAHGVKVHDMDELADRGVVSVMEEVRAAIGPRPTYVTFDIDAVDPAFAPGTGTPMPGGLSSREALRLVRGLSGLRLVGMDVVEVLPAHDHADATSLLAACLLMEGLAALGPAT
jgi:agmatinase